MAKKTWKAGTFVYPLPVAMVSCGDYQLKKNLNIITVAWTGSINTDPPMTYVSIRPSRFSYEIIKNSSEFVINLSTKKLAYCADYCGVKSGFAIDKFKTLNLTPEKSDIISAPSIKESPVNIECKVFDIICLGSHDMFLAKVLSIRVDEIYFDELGKFHLDKSNPICYCHGNYYTLGHNLGKFGYSVKKNASTTKKHFNI